METIIQFFEEYLGKVQYGWTKNDEGEELPFQIVKYSNGPFSNTTTYSTLGLSKYSLVSPVSGKRIRQEVIFISYSNIGDKNIPAILQQVGLMAIQRSKAFLRGNVIGPYGSLFKNSNLEALYSTIPVYFPDGFHTYSIDGTSSIVINWLIPITSKEALFIREKGWDHFEDKLEDLNPDLIDFNRKSII